MGAGLVDRVQVTLFPVVTGQTGLDPIFQGAADFDLKLIENRTLDGSLQELVYRPTLHAAYTCAPSLVPRRLFVPESPPLRNQEVGGSSPPSSFEEGPTQRGMFFKSKRAA